MFHLDERTYDLKIDIFWKTICVRASFLDIQILSKVGAGLGGLAPGSWYEPLSDDETLLLQGIYIS